MALSRIWSAFILVAILVASGKAIFYNDSQIYSRMVVGKADDPYAEVRYTMVGSPEKAGFHSKENFVKYLEAYGYLPADSVHPATTILAENTGADSVVQLSKIQPGLTVFSFTSIQKKLVKKADGIIETCKAAVNISIGLIGIMALFMGFMSIA